MRFAPSWDVRLALLFGFGFGLCLLAACVSHDEEAVDSDSAPVQSSSVDQHFIIATTALAKPMADAQRATGALLVPRRSPSGDDSIVTAPDGTPIRSSCGVTFIDRTHAITAGHCTDPIDIPNIDARSVTVELYDVSPELDWRKATTLTGTFPAYKHAKLAGTPGYDVTRLSCKVAARCAFGGERCPEPAKSDNADIALLTCDDPLPEGREPIAPAESDDLAGPVRAFWFHEIYDAPTSAPSADSVKRDLYLHYTTADETGAKNLHYFDDGRNDLLPLMSADWRASYSANATSRTRLGAEGTVVWTDLFGCHGTSGSGVMTLDRNGRYVLLGPVATASRDWGSRRLCTDLASHRIGKASTSYTALKYVKAMAALAGPAASE